jgi:alpha-ketoglutarate-dependent taurine dioxygenase
MSHGWVDSLRQRGFALLPGLRPADPTEIVAASLGSIASVEGTGVVQTLRPRDRELSPPNIYSGAYGTDAFPLHTDLAHWSQPPRYLLLRCIVGSRDVPTRMADGTLLTEALGSSILARTLVQPRRPIAGKKPLLRILENARSTVQFLRWDRLFTTPATKSSAEVFSRVCAFLDDVSETRIYLVDRGDTLILDNWRMLHGRAPVPSQSRNRHIERVYLNSITTGR